MPGVEFCIIPICFLLSSSLLPGELAGESTESQAPGAALSLQAAQHTALERNWDLLAAAKGIDAAVAQTLVVREFPNPTTSLSTMKIGVDHHPSSTPAGNGFWDRSYDTIFAINQLFEIGGKRGSRKVAAQAGLEGARAQFFDAKRTLDFAITKAYVGAAQALENVRVLAQSAATLREEARLADIRLRAGEISSSDKAQIEVAAERFELDARSAESTAAQARIALEILLGIPKPRGELRLDDSLETLAETRPPAATPESLLQRPDVVASEAAVRKSEAELRLQKANRIPDPTVLAQYEHEPPDQPNTVGFGLSFPIPLWNRNRGNILAAEAVRDQARLALEKNEAQAAADIASAQVVYRDALNRWQSYRDSIRPKSEQVRKAIAYSYQKGGASLLDLLVAERNDNEVRLAAAQASADTATAVAALKAALTLMPMPTPKR